MNTLETIFTTYLLRWVIAAGTAAFLVHLFHGAKKETFKERFAYWVLLPIMPVLLFVFLITERKNATLEDCVESAKYYFIKLFV